MWGIEQSKYREVKTTESRNTHKLNRKTMKQWETEKSKNEKIEIENLKDRKIEKLKNPNTETKKLSNWNTENGEIKNRKIVKP